ncbi:hypothetical protein [Nocardia asiatica]|uniref:hypothetical protein n=1 Tax=Nocardia asiatica TaxID=209252 RepID=UPI003EE1D263
MGSEAVIWDPETIRPLFAQMTERAHTDGVITEQERGDLAAAMEDGIARGDYHLSVTMFAVLGHAEPNAE